MLSVLSFIAAQNINVFDKPIHRNQWVRPNHRTQTNATIELDWKLQFLKVWILYEEEKIFSYFEIYSLFGISKVKFFWTPNTVLKLRRRKLLQAG